jgi:hypothetical protein
LANLGYWVRTSATGHGVATRAARLVAQFGIEKIGLLRVEIVVAIGNIASMRVAEKAGAKREGILRNRLVGRDKVLDAVMHSLTQVILGFPFLDPTAILYWQLRIRINSGTSSFYGKNTTLKSAPSADFLLGGCGQVTQNLIKKNQKISSP